MLLQEKYLDQLVDKVVARLAEERRDGGSGAAGRVGFRRWDAPIRRGEHCPHLER